MRCVTGEVCTALRRACISCDVRGGREQLACGGLDAGEDRGVDGLQKAEHHEGEAVGVERASGRVVEVDM